MDATLTVRQATVADVPIIIAQRRLMFESMGFVDGRQNNAMEASLAAYLPQAIAGGDYVGWLVTTPEQKAVAGGGVCVLRLPPTPSNNTGYFTNVMNLYVEPTYRRRGIARHLMTMMVEWCRSHGYRDVRLQASATGRPLYASMGFTPTNEMRLLL